MLELWLMVFLRSRDECAGSFLHMLLEGVQLNCSKHFSDNIEDIRRLSINGVLTGCQDVALGGFIRHTLISSEVNSMRTEQIREAYLSFFEDRGHRVVPSSALVPLNDPTLLFTSAGMVQFKDALLGRERLDYSRATSCQRCIRAGGKHNDLANVGYTSRHHTMFEMLGNFSFGDYFKEEAIDWAWTFVTEVLDLAVDKIWVTVHPTDEEARNVWAKKIGIRPDRLVNHADNFWAMGDTGPCGPDSEIFYDQGPSVVGGPPGSPDEDGDRFLEIWNLVFPQFDRTSGDELVPLAAPGVDTGMGIERVASIKQGVHSNYQIDLFQVLLNVARSIAGISQDVSKEKAVSLNVLADHIRSVSFLIADGVIPANDGRGYVLRRIIRRASRHGHKLGIDMPFFYRLVEPLVEVMGSAYPVLIDAHENIVSTVQEEEDRFHDTLRRGMDLLSNRLKAVKGDTLSGDTVFELFDTHGFPVDLTADIAREYGLKIDEGRFSVLMERQRERARTTGRFGFSLEQKIPIEGNVEFLGYGTLRLDARVIRLIYLQNDEPSDVQELSEGQEGIVMLDRTSLYAEAGGQIGDRGDIQSADAKFVVVDTTKGGGQYLHRGYVKNGSLKVGDFVSATVDEDHRSNTARNHSATHLLHAALREVLGEHVKQQGSLVDSEHLRFDFSHDRPLTQDEISSLNRLVNTKIRQNSLVKTDHMTYDDAMSKGAIALFGEKYDNEVRVLIMGNGFSVELCGGTHVNRTGDIGFFYVKSQSGIAAGIRRIEAVTGTAALVVVDETESMLTKVARILKTSKDDAVSKVHNLVERVQELGKALDSVQLSNVQNESRNLIKCATSVGELKVVAVRVDKDAKTVMALMDDLRSQMNSYVVVLASIQDGKVSLVCGVPKHLASEISARDVINFVADRVGARGGGRLDLARAGGGNRPEALPVALESVSEFVREKISI